jgi:AcrR family transcriptional regulator
MAQEPKDVRLPPGLDVLWGKRGRGQRGPKPGLTVDAIVDAAMDLADEGGLPAVSMANVARRLGFTTMSLYRYVTSKEELLQLMWNGSARGTETLVLAGHGWRERLRQWAIVQREMLDRHPWITQMPMAAPPMAPNSLAFVEKGLQAMDGAELTDGGKMRAIGLLSSYTLSDARMAYDARQATAEAAGAGPATGTGAQAPPSFEHALRLLVDEATYPRLHHLAWSSEGDSAPDEWAMFLAGIDCILDGIQAEIDRNEAGG